MAVCDCNSCVGLVAGLHRNTIQNHRKRGIASPADGHRKSETLRDGVLSPSDEKNYGYTALYGHRCMSRETRGHPWQYEDS